MNYAIFGEWVRDRVEELVGFGVPRADAEEMAHYLEASAIAAEATARSEAQFVIEFRKVGSGEMAKRTGRSPQAMRKRFNRLINRNHGLRSGLREEA
jgi:hypothetical protein